MIDLYTWMTPNGRKASIMLEEIGLAYKAISVNIVEGEQHDPEFLKISPNNKIPAMVDHEVGISMMESGAILLYLAEKSGRLMPSTTNARWEAMQWLMMQMGSVGPMLGQTHHFHFFNPGKSPFAETRYLKETARIYSVLNKRLRDVPYLAGREYSIADVATWPWIARFERHGIDWSDSPSLKRWYLEIAERPAVQRGYDVPKKAEDLPLPG